MNNNAILSILEMHFWYSAFVYFLGRLISIYIVSSGFVRSRSKNYYNLHKYNNRYWRYTCMSLKWTNQCAIRSMNLFVGNAKVMDWCGVTFRLSKIYIKSLWLASSLSKSNGQMIKIPSKMFYERENVFFRKIEGFLWIISEKALPKRLTPICYVTVDS